MLRRSCAAGLSRGSAIAAPRLGSQPPRRFASNSKLLAFATPVSAERPIKFERTLLADGFRISHPLPEGNQFLPPRTPLRTMLTPEEVTELKELRTEDPFGWSQSQLSKRYNVPGELIGAAQRVPRAKYRAIKERNVPPRKDVIARRRWAASNRIEQGLPPRTELLPEPDIKTYNGRRWVKPHLDQRTQEQRVKANRKRSETMFLPSLKQLEAKVKKEAKAAMEAAAAAGGEASTPARLPLPKAKKPRKPKKKKTEGEKKEKEEEK